MLHSKGLWLQIQWPLRKINVHCFLGWMWLNFIYCYHLKFPLLNYQSSISGVCISWDPRGCLSTPTNEMWTSLRFCPWMLRILKCVSRRGSLSEGRVKDLGWDRAMGTQFTNRDLVSGVKNGVDPIYRLGVPSVTPSGWIWSTWCLPLIHSVVSFWLHGDVSPLYMRSVCFCSLQVIRTVILFTIVIKDVKEKLRNA